MRQQCYEKYFNLKVDRRYCEMSTKNDNDLMKCLESNNIPLKGDFCIKEDYSRVLGFNDTTIQCL